MLWDPIDRFALGRVALDSSGRARQAFRLCEPAAWQESRQPRALATAAMAATRSSSSSARRRQMSVVVFLSCIRSLSPFGSSAGLALRLRPRVVTQSYPLIFSLLRPTGRLLSPPQTGKTRPDRATAKFLSQTGKQSLASEQTQCLGVVFPPVFSFCLPATSAGCPILPCCLSFSPVPPSPATDGMS